MYIYTQKAETREGAGGSVMENRLGGHSHEQSGKSHEEHWQQTHTVSGITHSFHLLLILLYYSHFH